MKCHSVERYNKLLEMNINNDVKLFWVLLFELVQLTGQ